MIDWLYFIKTDLSVIEFFVPSKIAGQNHEFNLLFCLFQVDEIPLPIAALPAELQAVFVGMPSQIPLPARAPHLAVPPPFFQQPHHSILKKTSAYKWVELI